MYLIVVKISQGDAYVKDDFRRLMGRTNVYF